MPAAKGQQLFSCSHGLCTWKQASRGKTISATASLPIPWSPLPCQEYPEAVRPVIGKTLVDHALLLACWELYLASLMMASALLLVDDVKRVFVRGSWTSHRE